MVRRLEMRRFLVVLILIITAVAGYEMADGGVIRYGYSLLITDPNQVQPDTIDTDALIDQAVTLAKLIDGLNIGDLLWWDGTDVQWLDANEPNDTLSINDANQPVWQKSVPISDGGSVGGQGGGKGKVKFNDDELYILDGDLGIGTEIIDSGTKVTVQEDTADADLLFEYQSDGNADNSDRWRVRFADGGNYTVESFATGSWVTVWTLSNAGVLSPVDLVIPQASPAVPGVDGGVELDFTDGTLVIQHGSAHAELGSSTDVVFGQLIKGWGQTVFQPDVINDVLTIQPINSVEYPHGIVVTAIYLGVSENTTYVLTFQNFDDFDTINGANPTIDTVTYTADTTGEIIDTSPTFATLAAGQLPMISIPATDVDWICFRMYFYVPAA